MEGDGRPRYASKVPTRVVVTGGAGFVGSSIALRLKKTFLDMEVVAFDNLHRRGSELTLQRLRQGGVSFVHGDVRVADDVEQLGTFDQMVECSAEPSVHAGYGSSPAYLVGTNLTGTISCLEAVRRAGAGLIFLSTSRVYPIAALRALPFVEAGERLALPATAAGPGWSANGIAADFPLQGYRSLYGATKLASELLIEEYRHMYDVPTVITRFGVIAGPWQMGKVDQGFVALWVARHLWGDSLAYTGFGGRGTQVRDVLHVEDVCDLVTLQLGHLAAWSGAVWNAGGGPDGSVSLRELTRLCEERAGRTITIDERPETSPADIPYYVTDNRRLTEVSGWGPRRPVAQVVDDVFDWLRGDPAMLRAIVG
jgi:CDP-paratose 2-epimerase